MLILPRIAAVVGSKSGISLCGIVADALRRALRHLIDRRLSLLPDKSAMRNDNAPTPYLKQLRRSVSLRD
jgi:hypothetical protein